ncbi:hypothetical protein NUH30_08735 [Leptospira sp. 85282-16]|uniref:LEPBI_I2678 family protein n=1 Tax=Leptospira sp. 85282-16 TaxID=2971256 RepID=UPI0021BF3B2A|nr:hypothetical protein [Leptospira sp. 85282-16]MCT8333755.1 hypothetical protein [Leptospira sp. 85282-16]
MIQNIQSSKINITFLLILFMSFNCATYMRNSSQELQILGPENSSIYIENEKVGESLIVTKAGFPELEKKPTKTIRVEKDGFNPESAQIESSFSFWFWGNILLLPAAPIGFITDYYLGYHKKYSPKSVVLNKLTVNPSFKIQNNNPSHDKFNQRVLQDKDKITSVSYGNLIKVRLTKVDESGKEIPDSEVQFAGLMNPNQEAQIKPGRYLIQGTFEGDAYDHKARIRYTAKVPGQSIIDIPGGGVGVFCGTIDYEKKGTGIRFLHINEEDTTLFQGILPRFDFLRRIALENCRDVFNPQDLKR